MSMTWLPVCPAHVSLCLLQILESFEMKFVRLVLLTGISLMLPAYGQDQYRHFAPTKDVAMLVDVSVSVRADKGGHEGAKGIIQELLAGRPFSDPAWAMEAGSPEMKDLFASYLGETPSPASAEMRPLMAAGNSFLSLPVGKLSTVLNGEVNRKLRDIQSIDELVAEGYPKEMNDTSTCYWFAMAQAADTLSQRSRLGYYLFVVSDEEDDPDYRADGPPNHTKADYDRYLKELAPQYPVESIRSSIAKYFLPARPSTRNAEMFTPRDSFKQVLIARFYQKGHREVSTSARHQKVRISWYAMGVAPEKVLVLREPPPPAPGVPAPKPVQVYQPPKMAARLQLLGGLGAGKKTFDYAKPILAWQIANLDSSGWDAGSRPSMELLNSSARPGGVLGNSPRKGIKSWQVSDQVGNGTHALELEIKDGSSGMLSRDIDLVGNASSTWWLTLFAILSGVAALGIFFFAWYSLREKRVAAPISA